MQDLALTWGYAWGRRAQVLPPGIRAVMLDCRISLCSPALDIAERYRCVHSVGSHRSITGCTVTVQVYGFPIVRIYGPQTDGKGGQSVDAQTRA